MTILDIANEIEAKKILTKFSLMDDKDDLCWKPQRVENYIAPKFIIPHVRSVKCTREKLSKVLAFIDSVKHIRTADCCTGNMPISTTNKRLISICGSQRNVSNLIKFMKQINLISDCNTDYQFNANNKEYNISKTYYYYIEVEREIKEYCSNNNINIYVIRNNSYSDTVVEKFSIDNFDNDKVRFSSKLHLLKPDNYSVAQFEEYLTAVLYKNYPELKHYQSLADEINDKYYADYPEMSLRFIPHFTWNKGNKAVRKIGIRCTNALVNAKKDKDDSKDFFGYYKEDILAKYGFNLDKDVKSSVPRITLSLNLDTWISEDIDIYEIIYERYKELKREVSHSDTVVEKFTSVRESIKNLHMRGYFDDEKTLGVHTRRAMANVMSKDAVDIEMQIFKKAIIQAEGGYLYDNEIFYHESCIYMDVLKSLLEKGYFTWICYDAFYAKKAKAKQEEFELLVTSLVQEKANDYMRRDRYREKYIREKSLI